MRSHHYQLFSCSQTGFRRIRELLPELAWQRGLERGFVLDEQIGSATRLRGRYIYTKHAKAARLDPETLQATEEAVQTLVDCRFELDQQKGLVMAEQRRGELSALYEALDALPDVHASFEELNLILAPLLFEVQSAYKKNTVKSIRIKDYLAREHMLTSATFKIMEPQDAERLVERFADQLEAFTLTLKLPDGGINLTVGRKGSVRASDDAPDELLLFAKDLLPRFHEAEVETTEVRDPVAARRRKP
jgi:hypothetical protein